MGDVVVSPRSSDSRIFGRLGSVSINDIIQLLAMTKRTATLVMIRGDLQGRVFFREGQIVHAAAGNVEGEDGLLRLLEWNDADFAVEEGIGALPRVSISTSTEALLLGSLTKLDEARNGRFPTAAFVSPAIERPRLDRRRRPPLPRRRSAARRRPSWIAAGAFVLSLPAVLLFALDPEHPLREVGGAPPWENLPIVPTPLPSPRPVALVDPSVLQLGAETGVAESTTLGSREPGEGQGASSVPGTSPTPDREPASSSPGTTAPPPAPETAVSLVAPAPTGHLTVIVRPWATVEIDGAVAGETPLARIPLSAGAHRIVLTNPNVVGVIRDEISLGPDESLVRRYDFDDVGYLLLLAEPWAEVEIDGRHVGQTPLSRLPVPAGLHHVRFRHPELGTRDETAQIGSKATVRLRVDWSREK